MSNPRVSVVLPVYNADDTLDIAIESIITQTEEDFQFVIVDDGSVDSSRAIINRWAKRDNRIDPVFINHGGIVSALNSGIRKAEGNYIARMDADDISLPRRLQRQADLLDQNDDIGLVSCLVEHLGNQDEQQGYARYVQWINSLTSPREININRFIESPLAHPSVMFRRKLVQELGRYRDGSFPEDYELWLRWLKEGIKMQKIPEVLLKWRDRPSRLSRNHQRYATAAFYKIKAKYLAHWLKQHNEHHPEVVIWGAGRTSRQRADMLTKHDIHITHYIDVDPNKIGQTIHSRPVWSPGDIPKAGSYFIISYVGNRGVNKKILDHLDKKKYKLGVDLIFAA